MTNIPYDLVVIGGGPAGYAGAIRAGQLGKKVACIEMERAGGTCLNWGCIPSKALLKTAELMQTLEKSADLGIAVSGVKADYAAIIKRSRTVADTMGGGIEFLFKKNKVDYIRGKACIKGPGTVEMIEGASKGQLITTKNILIATGCRPRLLPGLVPDGKHIFTSREFLACEQKPASMIVLGAGAIGVEFAYFLNALGVSVDLVEMLPAILPIEDQDISETLKKALVKQGIRCHTGVKAENIKVKSGKVSLDLIAEGVKTQTLESEGLLVAIGVMPYLEGLIDPKISIALEKGFIKVNDAYQTNIPGIYAAGDIIGAPWLAHVATYEAIQAVNGLFGIEKPKRGTLFPGCTYCQPQVASVGLTEKQAREKGLDFKIGKFPFSASGKAVAIHHPEGFVKVLIDKQYGEILGAHIIGYDATELIAEYALAMNSEMTADEIHATIHAHPTLSEALAEAVAAASGEAIHI